MPNRACSIAWIQLESPFQILRRFVGPVVENQGRRQIAKRMDMIGTNLECLLKFADALL